MDEAAAESFWDVHEFVDYDFGLFFFGEFVEFFGNDFYEVESFFSTHSYLHCFPEGVASGDGVFGF